MRWYIIILSSPFTSFILSYYFTLTAGLVTATANAMAASADAGLESVAVSGARFFLNTLNLEQFTRDVVIRMVQLQHDKQAGRLNLAAVCAGEFSLITRLSAALLCNGCAEEAAAVSQAFWEVANDTAPDDDDSGTPLPIPPSTIAGTMAPAIVTAVDAGHALTVAEVQRLLIQRGCHLLVVWLTYAVATVEGRPDAVSKGTIAALGLPGGEDLASNIAALTMVEGHYEVAAKVAGLMYKDAKEDKTQSVDDTTLSSQRLTTIVTRVVANAASQSIGIRQIQPVIKVTELLFEQQDGELAAGAVMTMLFRGEVKAVATVSVRALHQGKRQLIVQLIMEMMAQMRHLGAILCLVYVMFECMRLLYRFFK